MSGTPTGRVMALLIGAWAVVASGSLFAQSPAGEPTPAHNVPADLWEDDAEQSELEVYLASANLAMQPAPAGGPPSLSTRGATGPAPSRGARPPMNRLASAPEMFGDFFMTGGNLNFNRNDNPSGVPPTAGSFTIPGAGGSRRVKIAENNKAMPADRLIFSYNHFENALQFTETPLLNPAAAITQNFPIDRYTMGIEKTFLDGLWSCEVRMPFQGAFGFASPDVTGNGGQIGNLAVIVKHLLVEDDGFAVVAGMGIDIPTGSDFTLIDATGIPPTRFTFYNDALHLLPYAGFALAGDQPYFVNGFLQVDIATGGNRVDAGPLNGPDQTLGLFTEQNLLFVDLGTGYFLYRDEVPDGGLNTLAAILEFHYTSSLQDTDVINGNVGGRPINYRNNFNRFDIVNITTGVQAQMFDNTSLRVAGVFPLGAADDKRFFDSELQVQVNRRF